ncbi:LytTR family DNA-binding domain-containing protein [uncultured Flavobacterium sp.]|uniref:LytR/AlgR family response regulator transcription factor n=1 Tax=uncultured Flavobacterium sp. TaxID=165435 RepID=UPI0025936BB6|nr:LytTR family DNA-binding domain-containing protein [uncultured Flavobacterium sp.]
MKLIKAIVIDSDPEIIKLFLNFSEANSVIIKVSGIIDNFKDGIVLIKKYKPDLVFLNPTNENLASFNLLRKLDFDMPKFIFISDDKSKAFDAFQYNAVDFLLKKLNFDKLIISIYKVINLLEMEITFQNKNIINSNGNKINVNEFIAISSSDRIELVKIKDIIYCKADGKYTEFVLLNKVIIVSSKNLGEYSSMLIKNNFFRIHHSYIVNVNQILKITKKDGFCCEFSNGVHLSVAKRRQEEFLKFLKLL